MNKRCNGNKEADENAAGVYNFELGPSSMLSLATITEIAKEDTHRGLRNETNSCHFVKEFLGYFYKGWLTASEDLSPNRRTRSIMG